MPNIENFFPAERNRGFLFSLMDERVEKFDIIAVVGYKLTTLFIFVYLFNELNSNLSNESFINKLN